MASKSEKPLECYLLMQEELGQLIQSMRLVRSLPRGSDAWLEAAAAVLHRAATAFAGPIESEADQVLLMLATPTLCAVPKAKQTGPK